MSARTEAWLSSYEASERLSVKRETLYAYASRGLITTMKGTGPRGRLYATDDVERLRTRHAARAGHEAVAAGALRFGEPVLETRISQVTASGPTYRGYSALDLCRDRIGFERVADLLWTGTLPGEGALDEWRAAAPLECDVARVWPLLKGENALPKMALILSALALADDDRHAQSDAAECARARAIVRWLAAAPGEAPRRVTARGVTARAPARASIAGRLLAAWRAPLEASHCDNVDRALVLCAEHELNASSFTARVAASTGADLYACLGAAVNTLSGGRHGGQCDRVEALVEAIGSKNQIAATVRAWLSRGESLPGFGHALYPAGDPRGALLLELARNCATKSKQARRTLALFETLERGGHPAPTLDAGLVALCHCLGLPSGSAATIFAVGRTAGWVAHALEQRASGHLLRPRARYVGPPSRPI